MTSRVIRYTTKPERAEENAALVRAVFAELAETTPAGLTYEAYRLEDGVSFVHVVTVDDANNPLTGSPAFAAFQKEIGDRVAEGPAAQAATSLGSYTSSTSG